MGEEESDSKRTRERKFWSDAEIDRVIEEEAQRQRENRSYKSDSDIIRTLILRPKNEEENDFRKDEGRELKSARYPGKCVNGENCVRPDRSFKAGERAWWLGPGRVMCDDCHSQLAERGDPELHRKELVLRKLERLIKQARRESDLALQENELDALPKTLREVLAKIKENEQLQGMFLTKYIENPEAPSRDQVRKFFNDQARQYLKVDRTVTDTREILLPRIMRKKDRKRIEQTQTMTKEREDDEEKQTSG
jgi:uncharacterized Fe-S cluster protein YjdI